MITASKEIIGLRIDCLGNYQKVDHEKGILYERKIPVDTNKKFLYRSSVSGLWVVSEVEFEEFGILISSKYSAHWPLDNKLWGIIYDKETSIFDNSMSVVADPPSKLTQFFFNVGRYSEIGCYFIVGLISSLCKLIKFDTDIL